MTAVTDHVLTGGSPITSYSLEWDIGTSTNFLPVLGFESNNFELKHIFVDLTKGNTY
jgi:hypothetical protein